MRTETIVKTYKTFLELTEAEQKKAIEENRDFNLDHDWWTLSFEDFTNIGSIMGIDIENIFFSGFCSQGDGACFTGDFQYQKGFLEKIKNYLPSDSELLRIAEKLQLAHRKSFYRVGGRISHNRRYLYAESINVDLDSDCDTEKNHDAFFEVLVDFGNWIYKRLENEYYYLQSDECIKQDLISNEVEFEV